MCRTWIVSRPSPQMTLRIVLIVVTFINMVVALYAHLASDWTKRSLYLSCFGWENMECATQSQHSQPLYRSLIKGENEDDTKPRLKREGEMSREKPRDCPAISMERYFVAMTILSFLGAIVSFLLEKYNTDLNRKLKKMDAVLNGALSFLLFIGVAVFVVSATLAPDVMNYLSVCDALKTEENRKKFKDEDEEDKPQFQSVYLNTFKTKLAAGGIGFLQAMIHLMIALMIAIPYRKKWVKRIAHIAPEPEMEEVPANSILPPPMKLRIALMILAFIVTLLGTFAHLFSDWKKKAYAGSFKLYRICEFEGAGRDGPTDCPDISMEYYFVTMLFLCLLGAIVSFLLMYFNKDSKSFKLGDFLLHAVLGFLLLIGVIVFVASAIQAHDVVESKNLETKRTRETFNNEHYGELYNDYCAIKLVAAIFALIEVILHGVIASQIGWLPIKQFRNQVGDSSVGNAEEAPPQLPATV